MELFAGIAPKTVENFRQFCTGIPNSLTSPSAPDSKNYERKAGRTKMINRSNLAEQLREYQIRSKHDWASVSFFSSTSNFTSSRVERAAAAAAAHEFKSTYLVNPEI